MTSQLIDECVSIYNFPTTDTTHRELSAGLQKPHYLLDILQFMPD